MLLLRAFAGLAFLLAAIAAAVFGSAGTTDFWQAALFLAVFGLSVTAITLYLAVKDQALLERRTHAGPVAEQEPMQKVVQALASIAFLSFFVISGLDRRFGWSAVATPFVIAGEVLVALGLYIVFRTFRENTFTSAVVTVESGQRVVTTGPYAAIRHPMYAGALLMLAGIPLGLGSLWALIAWLPMFAVIVLRLLDEEKFLSANLAGYGDYCRRVKRRLVPGLW